MGAVGKGTVLATVAADEHDQAGHPENAGRLAVVSELLESAGVLTDLNLLEARKATLEQLRRVHNPGLIEAVRQASFFNVGRMDADTYVTPHSYELARLAAGTVAYLLQTIVMGAAGNGIALVRPPGHHAGRGRVGGFCLFNNVAVAAGEALARPEVSRVMILDFDVHHGNGTQDIFYLDPAVLVVSLHMYHPFFYPGSGAADELGAGPGQGYTLNVPFEPGAGDDAYLSALRKVVAPKARQFAPDIILVSAGFDAHWSDPLAMMDLSLPGYAALCREIVLLADELCHGKLLFVLEGGYHRTALSYGVLNAIYALLGRDQVEDPLGPAPSDERDMSKVLAVVQRLHLLSE
jgi:acetoin utilization deacetylase AcuC-like enzyme